MQKRSIWICLSKKEVKTIEEYAKAKGMLNISQAIEDLAKGI